MKLQGRRFHIAGSAHASTSVELLAYGHSLIAGITDALLQAGASVTVGVGKEPRARESDPGSPATIFDWTVLAQVSSYLSRGGSPRTAQGPVVAIVASSKTEAQIPEDRRSVFERIRASDAILLEFLDGGWSSGAVRRQRQAQTGDVLILLSGGEGVEHLAQLYVDAGKPVIPLDLNLGASSGDGSGGAARLHTKALAAPREFVAVEDPSIAALLLSGLGTQGGQRPICEVVSALFRLIEALVPPTVFYVRLLNPSVDAFGAVERFFRQVVDPVVEDLGYTQFETGRNPAEYAWMNEEVFDKLHHSSVAVVDITGLRSNCLIELGYALGRQLRTVVTAMKGAEAPFDAEMVRRHAWEDTTDDAVRRTVFANSWAAQINRPPLVRPRSVV